MRGQQQVGAWEQPGLRDCQASERNYVQTFVRKSHLLSLKSHLIKYLLLGTKCIFNDPLLVKLEQVFPQKEWRDIGGRSSLLGGPGAVRSPSRAPNL